MAWSRIPLPTCKILHWLHPVSQEADRMGPQHPSTASKRSTLFLIIVPYLSTAATYKLHRRRPCTRAQTCSRRQRPCWVIVRRPSRAGASRSPRCGRWPPRACARSCARRCLARCAQRPGERASRLLTPLGGSWATS